MSIVWLLLLVGWTLLWGALITLLDYRKHKREVAAIKAEARRIEEQIERTKAETRHLEEISSKLKAELQAREFEQWMEATRDKCDNHHKSDCPDVPGYGSYEALLQEDGEVDLDPTDLFVSEKMRLKREERQFLESLKAELREDHPKRKRKKSEE